MSDGRSAGRSADGADGLNHPLDDLEYGDAVMPEENVAVNESAQYASPGSVQIGAKAIQWKWWAFALSVSIGLWLVIGRFFGVF